MSTAASVAPDTLAAELAEARARFRTLEIAWNAKDRELAKIADKLKACGRTVERLERQLLGPAVPDYGAESGVVT